MKARTVLVRTHATDNDSRASSHPIMQLNKIVFFYKLDSLLNKKETLRSFCLIFSDGGIFFFFLETLFFPSYSSAFFLLPFPPSKFFFACIGCCWCCYYSALLLSIQEFIRACYACDALRCRRFRCRWWNSLKKWTQGRRREERRGESRPRAMKCSLVYDNNNNNQQHL